MQMPEFVKAVLEMLENAGFESYLVGGCVRDALLCRPCFDYDITTSALPYEIKAALSPIKTIDTGISHGTVTAVLPEGNIEITTFRGEGAYSDHRHPDKVTFSTKLCDDLGRRDFTINALAFNKKGGIIDLFGGKSDLEAQLIRTVGNADERFNEDALRILRALRFAACLNFEVEQETAREIHKNFKLLSYVSKERIYSELKKLICGQSAQRVLYKFYDVFNFIFDIKMPQDFYRDAAGAFSLLPAEHSLRFAALFMNLGWTRSERILSSLKSDGQTRNTICSLICHMPIAKEMSSVEIKRLLGALGEEQFKNLILLETAAENLSENQAENLVRLINEILKNDECYKLSQLKISGDDLLSLGFKDKQIGQMLEFLLNEVICEKLENEHKTLILTAQKIKASLD